MNVRLLAAGLALVGFLEAAHAGAAALPRISIALVSGTPQHAHAYIAQHGNRFETQFTTPLAVRVGHDTSVRFRCTTADCTFPAQFGPNDKNYERVDTHTFDVKSVDGIAKVAFLISTATVETVTVVARPAANATGPAVTFTLVEQ